VTDPSTADDPLAGQGSATCYRHPDREAHIRCVRCNRRICPSCMVAAAVGFQCPECVRKGNQGVRRARTAFGGRVTSNPGAVTSVIIAVNVVVFVVQQTVSGFTSRYDEAPFDVDQGDYYRLLTGTFLHANVLHIGLNMLALYMFGPYVEAALGRVRYAALYLLAAVGGSAVSYAFSNPCQASIGASGAVFGVLGAFLVVNRRLGRDSGGVVALLLINFLYGFVASGIDWRAHLGGLVTGGLAAAVIVYAPARSRTLVQVAGLIGVALLVVALVLWRSAELTPADIASCFR
jgi:membrane associated rhomboid family serine protease